MPWGKIFSGGSDESSRPILLRFALDGWCRRVLALDPVPRPTGAVGRVEALRHDAFEPELAHTAFPSVSLIKVLYCFHQNKAGSKCEVVHTSHLDSVPTIRPSEFGLLAGGDACAGSSSTNIKSSIRKIKKRFVAGFGLIPLLERYCRPDRLHSPPFRVRNPRLPLRMLQCIRKPNPPEGWLTNMREHMLLFCLLGLVLTATIILVAAPGAVTWALALVFCLLGLVLPATIILVTAPG